MHVARFSMLPYRYIRIVLSVQNLKVFLSTIIHLLSHLLCTKVQRYGPLLLTETTGKGMSRQEFESTNFHVFVEQPKGHVIFLHR
jgi:hypothetical protein